MKQMLIRYKTKPGAADENQRLVEAVFRELHAKAPEGVRYMTLRLDDGTFVHFVSGEDGVRSPVDLDAFAAFQDGIEERCSEPPRSGTATIVGNYRMLDDRP